MSDTLQILFQRGVLQNMERGLICINFLLNHQSPNPKKGNEDFFSIVKARELISVIFFICWRRCSWRPSMSLASRCSKAVISSLMLSLMACTSSKGQQRGRFALHLKSALHPRFALPHCSIITNLSFLNGNIVDNERAQEREGDSREKSLQRQDSNVLKYWMRVRAKR